MRTARLVVLLLLLFPAVALANVGGPLLLFVHWVAFIYGMVLIVLVEWGLYVRLARLPAKEAFWDALIVNLVSTAAFGIVFPVLVGTIGFLGMGQPTDDVLMAVGTWVYDGIPYPRLTFLFTVFWTFVTYLLTVYCEAWFLSRRWRARGVTPPISARALNWLSNTITYLGLFLFLFASSSSMLSE